MRVTLCCQPARPRSRDDFLDRTAQPLELPPRPTVETQKSKGSKRPTASLHLGRSGFCSRSPSTSLGLLGLLGVCVSLLEAGLANTTIRLTFCPFIHIPHPWHLVYLRVTQPPPDLFIPHCCQVTFHRPRRQTLHMQLTDKKNDGFFPYWERAASQNLRYRSAPSVLWCWPIPLQTAYELLGPGGRHPVGPGSHQQPGDFWGHSDRHSACHRCLCKKCNHIIPENCISPPIQSPRYVHYPDYNLPVCFDKK